MHRQVLWLACLVKGFNHTLHLLELLASSIMDFLGNTFKMQRASSGFIQKTLSLSYNFPKLLRTNFQDDCLKSFIMQMQHLSGGGLSYTRRTWRTLWSWTHFHITGTPLGWIHRNQSSPLCVLDGQRLTLTISSGFATHPMPEADELLPATIAGTSMESKDKVRSDELGSVGPESTPNTNCPFHSTLRGAMQPSWELVHWYLDWFNHNRDKLGKWSDWLTDVRDKWSLWNLSDAFKLKTGTIQMKVRHLTWWYTLRSASKVPILGSKDFETKQFDVPNEWVEKRRKSKIRLVKCFKQIGWN